MSPDGRDAGTAPRQTGAARRTPPWTVVTVAGAAVIQAVIIGEHARRLLTGVTTSEETLGLSAIAPLDQEVPTAVIEFVLAVGLLVAAVAIVRRSRLALVYLAAIQAVLLLELILRVVGGFTIGPTIGMALLAAVMAAMLAAAATRNWCTEPLIVRR